ncbi:MAG: hypothetical protein R2759_15985 [Bacteroidales bacterium]
MKLTFVFALIFGMIWQLNAQNFAGVFTLEANGSIAYLSLETKDSVNYTRSLIIENTEFDVDGKMLNGVLSGRIGQLPNINFFDAGFVGNVLNLTMMESLMLMEIQMFSPHRFIHSLLQIRAFRIKGKQKM